MHIVEKFKNSERNEGENFIYNNTATTDCCKGLWFPYKIFIWIYNYIICFIFLYKYLHFFVYLTYQEYFDIVKHSFETFF